MSNSISHFLSLHPLLKSYTQKGLVNFNALARYMKESGLVESSASLAALGMELRRYISKLPIMPDNQIDFSKYRLQMVVRTNINELVLNKSIEDRKLCTNFTNKISQTKHFSSVIEGERELVLMTDYPLDELLKKDAQTNMLPYHLNNLSFISINFPVELRSVPGVYNIITSCLYEMNVSIHSFHTIGGEILILVKDHDLPQAEKALRLLIPTAL